MYVRREAEELLNLYVEMFPSVAVVGPRRSGKTTLLQKVGEQLGAEYVTFDDPLELEVFNRNVKEFLQKHSGRFLILDEIQYASDVGRKVKYIVDVEKRKVLMAGSSSVLLSKEVLSFLVGRVGIVELYPFSFVEVERARAGNKHLYPQEKEALSFEYLRFGGYPEVVLEKDETRRWHRLRMILGLSIKKDVAYLADVEEPSVVRVVEALSRSIGSPVNFSSIAEASKLSYREVRRVVDALLGSFLIFEVRPFFTNPMKELVKSPKLYFVDVGLLHSLTGGAFQITGPSLENAVASEIVKSGLKPLYWRQKTGTEVDFVIKQGSSLIPVEVKRSGGKRRGLISFIKKYGENVEEAFVVKLEGEEKEKVVEGVKVKELPFWRFAELLRSYAGSPSGSGRQR
ncbi:MAG: ATP-binding protein [Candidatus Diapherotrites archaeon]|nr:ATP-binding protein [Candidatus Diapherotrites archaeon]